MRPPMTMSMPRMTMKRSPRVAPPGPMTAPVMREMPPWFASSRFCVVFKFSSWF